MTILTEQQYIVHLDIRATAPDPSRAVQEALEQVQLRGLGNVACSVEAVGGDAQCLSVPAPAVAPEQAMAGPWRDPGRLSDRSYCGEFLG